MREQDTDESKSICDAIIIFSLGDTEESDEVPAVIFEQHSSSVNDKIAPKSIYKFARPRGWFNGTEPTPPEFFYQLLTSETGFRRIAYVLSTWQYNSESSLYNAVSIVIISRLHHPSFFKELLIEVSDLARKNYENEHEANRLIYFLTEKQIPTRSRISIEMRNTTVELENQGDDGLVNTDTEVADLFRYLGFRNTINIVQAILCDARVVIQSNSMMRLSRAQNALMALINPFIYMHSCITILPDSLFELLESPTPYIVGVLSDYEAENGDDIIVINLDTGEVKIPSSINILECEPLYTQRLIKRIQKVLFPTASQEDIATCNHEEVNIDKKYLDKQLRACFLLYFAELVYGYQYFILYTKKQGTNSIKNPASLTFHDCAFRGFRRLDDEFSRHLLKSAHFQAFLTIRAHPQKKHDLFDVISCLDDIDVLINKRSIVSNDYGTSIESIANQLYNSNQFSTKCTHDTDNFAEIRLIDMQSQDSGTSRKIKYILSNSSPCLKATKIVPVVDAHLKYHSNQRGIHAHRIEVLGAFIESVFTSSVATSKKTLKAVEMSMRYTPVRIEYCQLLERYSSQSILSNELYEVVVALTNAALQNEDVDDKSGVVNKLMHLASVFCRRLPRGVYQYMYTSLQHHKVWRNAFFWTNSFYYQVHEACFSEIFDKRQIHRESLYSHVMRPCAMEIVEASASDLKIHSKQEEEEIIQAQVKHYANMIICFHVPMNAAATNSVNEKSTSTMKDDQKTTVVTKPNPHVNVIKESTKFVSNLIDTILSTTGRSSKLSIDEISCYVEAHMETLREVCEEVFALGELSRDKIYDPALITPYEHLICDPINCVLLSTTGREKESSRILENFHELNCSLLPAEGNLFVTNYRVIFKGKSLQLHDEHVVSAIPLRSIVSLKRLTPKKDQQRILKKIAVNLIISIKSQTCAELNVAIDEESVNVQSTEKMIDVIENNFNTCFAYSSVQIQQENAKIVKSNRKVGTISTLRKLEGTLGLSKAKTDMWKFRTISSHRGSYSPSIDITDCDESSAYGPDIHRRYAAIDFSRIGFVGKNTKLRITHANSDYSICETYPGCFIVPYETSDSHLAKVAKGFLENRLPVVTWMNSRGALLIRGSAFSTKDVVKKFRNAVTGLGTTNNLRISSVNGSQQTLTSKASSNDDSSNIGFDMKSSEAQVYYLAKLADASPTFSVNSLLLNGYNNIDDPYHGPTVPQEVSENGSLSSKGQDSLSGDVRLSVASNSFKRALDVRSTGLFDTNDNDRMGPRTISITRKPLYILVEKGTASKIPLDTNAEIIHIRLIKESAMRRSLHRLIQSLNDKDSVSVSDSVKKSFIQRWKATSWPESISRTIELSNSIVALMSLNNSSVALFLESGMSATAQICSLVQLLSDPFYRTIEGFQVLIEKEWLAMGYNFNRDSEGNLAALLLFCDCVHQIMNQFPNAFEFSGFFLRFVAYHTTSGFFRTFLENCESRRIKYEIESPEVNDKTGRTIWNYIHEKRNTKTDFVNISFYPCSDIILPSSSFAQITVWSLFTENNHSFGSPYDIDAFEKETKLAGNETSCVSPSVIDAVATTTISLTDDKVLQTESSSIEIAMCSMQKKYALDLLHLNNQDEIKSKEYNEENRKSERHKLSTFTPGLIPAKCGRCGNMITKWSRASQCKKCQFQVHRSCVDKEFTVFGILHDIEPTTAVETIVLPRDAILNDSRSSTPKEIPESPSNASTLDDGSNTLTIRVPVPPLISGYLSKKGATFKVWTPRYYVIYPDNPKIFYYDTFEQWKVSSRSCGHIDLEEIATMEVITSGRRAVIELKMRSKTIRLLADNYNDASKWTECMALVLKE